MNYSYSVGLSTPSPGRITDAIAPTQRTSRWLLEVATPRFGELNTVSFDCLVEEVLERHGRTLSTSGTLTLAEFEKLRVKATPSRPANRRNPDAVRLEVLYENIRQLFRKRKKQAAILAYLKSPDGKDLNAEVQWELKRNPTTTRGKKQRRTEKHVVAAALRKVYAKQPNKRP